MTALLSLKDLKSIVIKKHKKNNIEEVLQYVQQKEINLWGVEKPRDYLTMNIYLCIYKYCEKIGFYLLWRKICNWYKNSHESLMHNCQVVLGHLGTWGRGEILLGDIDDWNDIARHNVTIPKGIKSINLWMDSCDFATKGKNLKLKKNENWSYKLKSLGRRFQFLMDADQRVRAVWGGYSPKLSDSQWVISHKEELSEILSGSIIVGDCGYYSSKDSVRGVSFETPVPSTVKSKENTTRNYTHITEKQNTKNKQIRNIRARVENPFAQFKNHFKTLDGTFLEDPKLLDSLVIFAVAIYNKSL